MQGAHNNNLERLVNKRDKDKKDILSYCLAKPKPHWKAIHAIINTEYVNHYSPSIIAALCLALENKQNDIVNLIKLLYRHSLAEYFTETNNPFRIAAISNEVLLELVDTYDSKLEININHLGEIIITTTDDRELLRLDTDTPDYWSRCLTLLPFVPFYNDNIIRCLNRAIKHNQEEVVDEILRRYAKKLKWTVKCQNPLHVAIENNRLNIVKKLLNLNSKTMANQYDIDCLKGLLLETEAEPSQSYIVTATMSSEVFLSVYHQETDTWEESTDWVPITPKGIVHGRHVLKSSEALTLPLCGLVKNKQTALGACIDLSSEPLNWELIELLYKEDYFRLRFHPLTATPVESAWLHDLAKLFYCAIRDGQNHIVEEMIQSAPRGLARYFNPELNIFALPSLNPDDDLFAQIIEAFTADLFINHHPHHFSLSRPSLTIENGTGIVLCEVDLDKINHALLKTILLAVNFDQNDNRLSAIFKWLQLDNQKHSILDAWLPYCWNKVIFQSLSQDDSAVYKDLLLRYHPEGLSISNEHGQTPLAILMQQSEVDWPFIATIIEPIDSVKARDLAPLLINAFLDEQYDIVKTLIASGLAADTEYQQKNFIKILLERYQQEPSNNKIKDLMELCLQSQETRFKRKRYIIEHQDVFPIDYAAYLGLWDVVSKMLDNRLNKDSDLVIYYAAKAGRSDIIERCLDQESMGLDDDKQSTVLHYCIKHHWFEAFKQLICSRVKLPTLKRRSNDGDSLTSLCLEKIDEGQECYWAYIERIILVCPDSILIADKLKLFEVALKAQRENLLLELIAGLPQQDFYDFFANEPCLISLIHQLDDNESIRRIFSALFKKFKNRLSCDIQTENDSLILTLRGKTIVTLNQLSHHNHFDWEKVTCLIASGIPFKPGNRVAVLFNLAIRSQRADIVELLTTHHSQTLIKAYQHHSCPMHLAFDNDNIDIFRSLIEFYRQHQPKRCYLNMLLTKVMDNYGRYYPATVISTPETDSTASIWASAPGEDERGYATFRFGRYDNPNIYWEKKYDESLFIKHGHIGEKVEDMMFYTPDFRRDGEDDLLSRLIEAGDRGWPYIQAMIQFGFISHTLTSLPALKQCLMLAIDKEDSHVYMDIITKFPAQVVNEFNADANPFLHFGHQQYPDLFKTMISSYQLMLHINLCQDESHFLHINNHAGERLYTLDYQNLDWDLLYYLLDHLPTYKTDIFIISLYQRALSEGKQEILNVLLEKHAKALLHDAIISNNVELVDKILTDNKHILKKRCQDMLPIKLALAQRPINQQILVLFLRKPIKRRCGYDELLHTICYAPTKFFEAMLAYISNNRSDLTTPYERLRIYKIIIEDLGRSKSKHSKKESYVKRLFNALVETSTWPQMDMILKIELINLALEYRFHDFMDIFIEDKLLFKTSAAYFAIVNGQTEFYQQIVAQAKRVGKQNALVDIRMDYEPFRIEVTDNIDKRRRGQPKRIVFIDLNPNDWPIVKTMLEVGLNIDSKKIYPADLLTILNHAIDENQDAVIALILVKYKEYLCQKRFTDVLLEHLKQAISKGLIDAIPLFFDVLSELIDVHDIPFDSDSHPLATCLHNQPLSFDTISQLLPHFPVREESTLPMIDAIVAGPLQGDNINAIVSCLDYQFNLSQWPGFVELMQTLLSLNIEEEERPLADIEDDDFEIADEAIILQKDIYHRIKSWVAPNMAIAFATLPHTLRRFILQLTIQDKPWCCYLLEDIECSKTLLPLLIQLARDIDDAVIQQDIFDTITEVLKTLTTKEAERLKVTKHDIFDCHLRYAKGVNTNHSEAKQVYDILKNFPVALRFTLLPTFKRKIKPYNHDAVEQLFGDYPNPLRDFKGQGAAEIIRQLLARTIEKYVSESENVIETFSDDFQTTCLYRRLNYICLRYTPGQTIDSFITEAISAYLDANQAEAIEDLDNNEDSANHDRERSLSTG